jgi:hypothetical protein
MLRAHTIVATALVGYVALGATPPLAQGGTRGARAVLPAVIEQAKDPGAIYRPVPLWWWDGDQLEIERLRWQLDQLHEQGVDQVCLIYLNPLGSQPPYFTEDWWTLYQEMVDHAARLGMKVWLTDGVAWGSPFINNTVLEGNPEYRGQLLDTAEQAVSGPRRARHEIPEGYEVTKILGAFAYRRTATGIDLEDRHDLTGRLQGRKLEWDAPEGEWQIMIFYYRPMGFQGSLELGFGRGYGIDYTNPAAMQKLIRLTTGEYDERVKEHVGRTVVGTFQDELVTHHHYGFPPFSKTFAAEFQERRGYDLVPRLGALFHEAGGLTDKVRCDYFEVLIQLFEEAFYRPYFSWHEERGMMIAHDQFGRMDLIAQTWGYGDYFRLMSWFQAPGYDDWNQGTPGRNWKDAKLAASIAQLYDRPRVWVEALHSSGWGLDLQEQVVTLNENAIYGANLYDKHGFDYTSYGTWYNWAPPTAHYRMPYWMHYRPFADYVTRVSFLQSQGEHLADVGVFYPVHTIQANYVAHRGATKMAAVTETQFWGVGRHLLQNQIDFHYVDDGSLQAATVSGGRISRNGAEFFTIVLPPLTTIDRRTLARLEEFVEQGGLLISLVSTPSASPQEGRDDFQVRAGVERLFGEARPTARVEREHPGGGAAIFLPDGFREVAGLVRERRGVDFETDAPSLMVHHRRAEGVDLYMLYNRSADRVRANVRVRAKGTPFRFDSRTGESHAILVYVGDGDHTRLTLDFDPYEAYHVYFTEGPGGAHVASSGLDEIDEVETDGDTLRVSGWHHSSSKVEVQAPGGAPATSAVPVADVIDLGEVWASELRPTMDNRWGDVRRPPSDEVLGAEVRRFRYRMEGRSEDGEALGWTVTDLDDEGWETYTASVGPYWWVLGPVPNHGAEAVIDAALGPERGVDLDRAYEIFGGEYSWRPYSFSLRFGLEKDPDYWRALGSKERVDPTFFEFGEAEAFNLVYLYTNVYTPRTTEALLVSRTSGYWDSHRVWVNGTAVSDAYHRDTSQQFGGLIGVHLEEGWNRILIKTNQRSRSVKFQVYLLEQDRAVSPPPPTPRSGPPVLDEFVGSDFVYDLYGEGGARVGWYRFTLPPGTRGFQLGVKGAARVWVNGDPQTRDPTSGAVRLATPLERAGVAAVRVVHERGSYGGAAIPEPVKVETGAGEILLGDWSDQGLLSYSGAVVYRQTLTLPADDADHKLVLDLGRVDATASVKVNGKDAGIRAWAPYRFDVTSLVQAGENELEVTVASALANHYEAYTPAVHVYEWQTESGLFGPVRILPYTRVEMELP